MSRKITYVTAAAIGIAAIGLAASPAAQASGNKRKGDTDNCIFVACGSPLDKESQGRGPGGQGGGKAPKVCSKVFAKWANPAVTVYISNAGAPANFATALTDYADNCFATWGCDSALTFSLTNDADAADITVTWGDLGSTGILGQTSTFYFGGIISASDVVMNSNVSSFNWTLGPSQGVDGEGCFSETANGNTSSANYDLLSVLLHEVGHSLGVSHPTNRCSTRDECYYQTMNPCTDAEEFMRRTLEDGDIKSIQTNYGL